MKLQLVCLIFILLSMTAQSLHAFRIETQVDKDSETHNAEEGVAETSGLQAMLRRSKRFSSHFPLCTYCCNCCSNKACGFCCRT
ncbi:hepcidin-like [Paroedura picta]|uniref:hepcidin-like n=1 Tax=Paroedura picta TaxID=143630 RepID=UPI004057C88E